MHHRDHVLLKWHRLDFPLVHDPDEQAEEGLTLEEVVAVLQVVHLLGLLGGWQDLSLCVYHYRGPLLPAAAVAQARAAPAVAVNASRLLVYDLGHLEAALDQSAEDLQRVRGKLE